MELPFYGDNIKDMELNALKLKYKPMIYIFFVKKRCQKIDAYVLGNRNRRKMLFNYNFFGNLYHS